MRRGTSAYRLKMEAAKADKKIFLKRGFTLIEILITVIIVGILASVVLLSLGPARRTARDTKRFANIRTVQRLLESYIGRVGQYPPASPTNILGTQTVYGFLTTPLRTQNVIVLADVLPNEPAGSPRRYGYQSTGAVYYLGVVLEGGIPSGRTSVDPPADFAGMDQYCDPAVNTAGTPYCVASP